MGPQDQDSRKLRSFLEREGCRSLRKALASIWRMRSRVTAKSCPTSSSVCSQPSERPKRRRSTFSSRGVSVLRTLFVCSRRERPMIDSTGDTTCLSSMKSPRWLSSSSPIGVSRELGSCAIFRTFRTLSTGTSILVAISSGVGSRPSSCTSWREVRMSLLIVSIMCTGMRIVRAWSAMARVMAWRIHQVAYVENLYPRRYSNLSTAFMRPMLPSWIRSRNCRPRFVYFLAIEMTSRRLASTISFLAMAALCWPCLMTVITRLISSALALARASPPLIPCWRAQLLEDLAVAVHRLRLELLPRRILDLALRLAPRRLAAAGLGLELPGLVRDLVPVAQHALDGAERVHDRAGQLDLLLLGELLLVDVHDFLDGDVTAAEQLAQLAEALERQVGAEDGHRDLVLALLDALGQRDLALAGE